MQVVEAQHDGRAFGKRVQQAGDGLEQVARVDAIVRGAARQIRIALVKLGQDARDFGEPDVGKQVLGGVFTLEARAQRVHEGRVGQRAGAGERGSAQDVGAVRPRPARELVEQAGLADAGFTAERHGARAATGNGVEGGDQVQMLGLAADEGAFERREAA
jgi:hypothetical protein